MATTLRTEDPSFVERAPILTREEVTLDASPAEVWPALAEAGSWVTWFKGMKEARYTSVEPIGVGSTRYVHVQSLKANEEILAFDVNERFAFRVDDVNVPMLAAMVEVVTLEPVGDAGDRTRLVYTQAVELKPWARLFGGVFKRQLGGALRQSLADLAAWLPARQGE